MIDDRLFSSCGRTRRCRTGTLAWERFLQTVNRLDYAPPTPRPRRRPFWGVFFLGWICGLPVTSFLDDAIKMYLTGRGADGGATLLAACAVIPASVIAGMCQSRTPWTAALVGGLSSPIAVTVIYLPAFWT